MMTKTTPAGKGGNSQPVSGLVYLLSDECPARHAEWERTSIARRSAAQQLDDGGAHIERRVDLREESMVDKTSLMHGMPGKLPTRR